MTSRQLNTYAFPTKPVLQGPHEIRRVGNRYIDGQKQRTPKISLRGSENGGCAFGNGAFDNKVA